MLFRFRILPDYPRSRRLGLVRGNVERFHGHGPEGRREVADGRGAGQPRPRVRLPRVR